MSTASGESDFSDLDELSSSAASTLSVPKLVGEKRKVSKTGSYPLEQFHRKPHTTHVDDTEESQKTEIYEWWEKEILCKPSEL